MPGKKKKYNCDFCNYKTAYKKDLIVHARRHTGEKPFECCVCGKNFRQIGSCKRHEASHTREKPFECDICQVRFTEKGSLVKHMRLHTGDELFKCTICDRIFSQGGHLKEHMRSHTNDRPYKCLSCEKSFKREETSKHHMLVHHSPGGKTYECNICKKTFPLPSYLSKHVRLRHTAKRHECLTCNKKFSTNYSLSLHIKIHTKKKSSKHSEFSDSKKKLALHENQPLSKKFQCKCQKSFCSKSGLKRHVKLKHPEMDFSLIEQSTNSSCETSCFSHVSVKECGPIGHLMKDPLELNSSGKYDEKSVRASGNDSSDYIEMTNVEKISATPNLCLKQEISSVDEISDEFGDYEIKEENIFALGEQTYDKDMKQMLEAEQDETSLKNLDSEFHTVYIKEEFYDSGL